MKLERLIVAFMLFFFVFMIMFVSSRIARGDEVQDHRCKFAIQAAEIPPTVPIEVVCEKPVTMIEGDKLVTLDCSKYCKALRLKGKNR